MKCRMCSREAVPGISICEHHRTVRARQAAARKARHQASRPPRLCRVCEQPIVGEHHLRVSHAKCVQKMEEPRDRVCLECNTPLPPDAYRTRKYCSKRCREKAEKDRARPERKQLGSPLTCAFCGEMFTRLHLNHRYCCAACSGMAAKAQRLMQVYGCDWDEAREWTKARGCPCPICGRPAEHLDHCHETGRIRGLLCSTCNPALGQLGDSPERFESAAHYLRSGGVGTTQWMTIEGQSGRENCED
jgi:predicted nucleic acid-binding Zn ribbon protein